MNANELADSLEAASSDMEYNYHVSDWKLLYECALVMRKQQAEIERLIGAKPITYGMLTFCKNCGQQNPYFEKAQDK